MRCEILQTKLVVGDALTPDEARHAVECSDCATFAAFDVGMAARLDGWRDPGPLPFRRRARSPRLALAGLGLAAALALAVALPARADARDVYRRMLLRVREVSSVHLVVRWRPGNGNVVDGPMRQTEELWWRPGAWRETWERGQPKIKLAGQGGITFFHYDPGAHRVESYHEASPQRDYRHFELADFAKDYMASPTRFEQPSPTTLVATNAEGWSRMTFTLDPATGLPTHAVKEHRGRGNVWETAGELDLEFDRPIPGALFDPKNLHEGERP